MSDFDYYDYLKHHGIKGQKWGVRRFQDANGRLTPAGRARYSRREAADGDLEYLAAYTAVVALQTAAAVASVKIRFAMNVARFNKDLKAKYDANEIKHVDELKKQKNKTSTDENLKIVNPELVGLFSKSGELINHEKYASIDSGNKSNCTFATAAMVMREKGYDVRAGKTNHGYYAENVRKFWNPPPKVKDIQSGDAFKTIEKLNKKMPDGSYGDLHVNWKVGGAHSVMWKKEKGSIVLYDGQSGTKYSTLRGADDNNLLTLTDGYMRYTRLDNVEPVDFVLAAVKKR